MQLIMYHNPVLDTLFILVCKLEIGIMYILETVHISKWGDLFMFQFLLVCLLNTTCLNTFANIINVKCLAIKFHCSTCSTSCDRFSFHPSTAHSIVMITSWKNSMRLSGSSCLNVYVLCLYFPWETKLFMYVHYTLKGNVVLTTRIDNRP